MPLAPLSGDYRFSFHTAQLSPGTLDWSFSVYPLRSEALFVSDKPATVQLGDRPVMDADGTVNLYLSQQRPGDVPASNWLPVPSGDFTVVYRAITATSPDPHDDFSALTTLQPVASTAE